MMISQSLKNDTQMFSMIFFILGVDQNIVNENHDEFIQLRHEDRIHQVHKICWGVGKTKRHNQIFIESISGQESSLWNITRLDFYLMVARTKIDLRENLGSS